MTEQLSVVIPTYKRTQSLERLLDCLDKQVNIDLEIIVVDQNEKSFFTGTLLKKLDAVKRIYQETPNASLARNNGFKAASKPYVLFLDDDLIPEPDFCIKGVSVFSDYPLIKCFVPLVYPENGKEQWRSDTEKKKIAEYPGNKLIYSITDFISAAVFFEKEYFELAGGFDPFLFDFAKASEDVELFLRMRQRNLILWFFPFLEIFHDETVSGGCDMRTAEYWITRKKNARAMAFRYRIHNKAKGKISFINSTQLFRSFVFNKKVLQSGIKNVVREIKLLLNSSKESNSFYEKHKEL